MGDGEARRADARGDVELAVDGAEMLADGALADAEALADFGIRQSTGNERKNFHLAQRETRRQGWPRRRGEGSLEGVGPFQRQPGTERRTDGREPRSASRTPGKLLRCRAKLGQRQQRERPLVGCGAGVGQSESGGEVMLSFLRPVELQRARQ